MDFLYTILMTLLTLGVLVTVHEFGHFWVARHCGVQVLRFSVGFGRPLLSWKDRHGTEYAVAWIPLGGYVRMLDEREAPVPEAEQSRSFNRQPVSRRMAIAAAGPAANFLLAILVLWLVYLGGVRGLVPVIDQVLPGSPAEQAGLQAGQEILAVDGTPTPIWSRFDWQLLSRLGDTGHLHVVLQASGSTQTTEAQVPLQQWLAAGDVAPREALGVRLRLPELPAVIGTVLPDSPAAQAGFQAGDRILAANGEAVSSWQQWVALIRAHPGQALNVRVERGNTLQNLAVVPHAVEEQGERIGQVGLGVKGEWPESALRTYHYGLFSAWPPAVADTWRYTSLTLTAIRKMVMGLLSPQHLSGPVTIAKVAGSSAKAGWQAYLEFLAMLSVSLAVINLLPVPVLDGGHLLLYACEAIRGRPLSERVQQWAFQIGLLLVIGITMLALFNDFSRLF